MKKVALPHLLALGIALCLATFLLWLFSPKQISSFHDIADVYGEIIGGILGVAGAFGVAIFTLHSERRQRRRRIALAIVRSLDKINTELRLRLSWIILGLGFSAPSSLGGHPISEIKKIIENSSEESRNYIAKEYNENFIENKILQSITTYSRDAEELPDSIFERISRFIDKIESINNNELKFHKNEISSSFNKDIYHIRLENIQRIIFECEYIAEMMQRKLGLNEHTVEAVKIINFDQ